MRHDVKHAPQGTKSSKPRRSGGSTLLGLFIGMVVGVVIAFGLVWYLNRTPTPFLDRSNHAEHPPVPLAPVVPGSGAVPEPLPGKPGDKPVEKPRFDFYNVLPKGSDALPAPTKPEETTEVVKPPPAKPEKADGKPGGDAERAKAEAALLDKPPVPETFFLQAGSFEDPSEADNLKARLALMGVEASVQKVELPEKGTVHRVRVGPYLGQEEMTKARQQLTSNGINAAIIKIKPKEPKPVSPAQ